jgi:hypothetical protein
LLDFTAILLFYTVGGGHDRNQFGVAEKSNVETLDEVFLSLMRIYFELRAVGKLKIVVLFARQLVGVRNINRARGFSRYVLDRYFARRRLESRANLECLQVRHQLYLGCTVDLGHLFCRFENVVKLELYFLNVTRALLEQDSAVFRAACD